MDALFNPIKEVTNPGKREESRGKCLKDKLFFRKKTRQQFVRY